MITNRQLHNSTSSVKTAFLITFLLFTNVFMGFNQTIYYVAEGGMGSGSSWDDASGDLQAMINAAVSGDQVWVATGTFYPDETAGQVNNNRLSSFRMKEGVKIYGSFAGVETSLSQRTPSVIADNPSILSGDIDKNGSSANNSYHVILNNQNGLTAAAVLDGFTIKGGNADAFFSAVDFCGGGIFNSGVSPTIRNCIFTDNRASVGGAMYNFNASPKVINSYFSGNWSTNNDGAGMHNLNGNPSVINCVFFGNNSGGMYNGLANTVIINCTFSGNTGYGIFNAASNAVLRNSIIWGNESEVINSNSTPTYTKTLVKFAQIGGFNGTDDPYFVDELNGNLHLSTCSPFINKGDNTLNTETTDLDGNARVQLSTIDLGAYEAASSNSTSLTLGTIPAICEGSTSFTLPYTATTGSPTTYSISGTGITSVTNAPLPSNSITVNLSVLASGSSIPFTLYVRNADFCFSTNIKGSVTVNALPTVSITGLNSTYYKCSAAVSLSDKGSPLGGIFKIDGSVTTTLDPSVLSFGTHPLTYGYTNANGCTNTATLNVTIATDNQTPIISCPTNMNISATGNDIIGNTNGVGCSAAAIFTVTATDNCSATVTQMAGYASGLNYPLGVTTNTFKATDPSGNMATCSFTVNVFDNTPPTFTSCPASVTINASPTPNGNCGSIYSYNTPIAHDNCLTNVRLETALGNGSLFPVGATLVAYRALDFSGNAGACSFTVTVVDNTPPQITCPSSITVNVDAGASSFAFSYATVTAADNCSATVSQTSGLASGAAFPIGTTTNIFRATDAANNTSTCSFSVTVVGDITTQVAASALHFDGVSDYVSTASQITSPSTFSIEAWFKTLTADGAIIGFGADQTGFRANMYGDRFIILQNGQVIFGIGYGSGTASINYAVSPSNNYNDGNFHHVAATYSFATGLKLYIDGQFVASNTPSVTPFSYAGYWRIGHHINSFSASFFKGTLDEVRIWNRVLTATEIQNNRNCELPSIGTTGLLNYYKFNKGTNNADNTALTTGLPDASGFANNGTLNSFALTGAVSNWKFPGAVTIGTTCNLVLPVELLDFTGKNTEGGNLLTWTTANEVNNKGFEVHRLTINGQWLTLDFVATKGKAAHYEFTDKAPLSTSYYRLRQIDNDGKEVLSKVISIERKGNDKLKVYPNPVSNILTIETNSTSDYQVINLLGQTVINGKGAQAIDVSALPKGNYCLKVGTQQVKFVKQ